MSATVTTKEIREGAAAGRFDKATGELLAAWARGRYDRDLLDLPNWTARRVCRDAEHLAATVASVVVHDGVRAEELQPAWLKPAAPRTDKKEHSPSQ
jgi:hypothetical protein